MKTDQRLEQIREFVIAQRYTDGLKFTVEPSDGDKITITFKEASFRQIYQINRTLRAADLFHISAKAEKIINQKDPKTRNHGKNH